eukprot:TRINITY_DN92140_c0_g1_i1.p1 TRINITY_DN92140_c0_g1~~TRINITY_DN92140_c0_g1_i1.p1  ORF type:complete len:1068 (+),score=207.35 TRINITY_DN92140_c0_g1_i1:176-3379(+)
MGKSASKVSKVESAHELAQGGDVDPKDGQIKYSNLLSQPTKDLMRSRAERLLEVTSTFVPWIIMQSHHESKAADLDDADVISKTRSLMEGSSSVVESAVAHKAYKMEGVVVQLETNNFSDIFEEKLSNVYGAATGRYGNKEPLESFTSSLSRTKELTEYLLKYYGTLNEVISAYRGDILKSNFGIQTLLFKPVDDTLHADYNPSMPPHGTYGAKDLGPPGTAVLRACACCMELLRRVNVLKYGVDATRLSFQMGVGWGPVHVITLGAENPPGCRHARCDYVMVGSAVEQASEAKPFTDPGEVCLSNFAWKHASEWAVEGRPLPNREYHILENLMPTKHTFPCVRSAATALDGCREQFRFKLADLDECRPFLSSYVFQHIENGLPLPGEWRSCAMACIQVSGIDVVSDPGLRVAQSFTADLQKLCHLHEGQFMKCLVDDAGLIFVLSFGLPPLVHDDDASRAVIACFDIVNMFRHVGLVCRIGITSGPNYVGLVDNCIRRDYVILGTPACAAMHLMANADDDRILVDEPTKESCTAAGILCFEMPPVKLDVQDIEVSDYRPEEPPLPDAWGLKADGTVLFPWPCRSRTLGGKSLLSDLSGWRKEQYEDGIARLGRIVMAISSDPGMGNVELAEFCVTELRKENAVPIFGYMGWRPSSRVHILRNMLASLALGAQQAIKELKGRDLKDVLRSLVKDSEEFREYIDTMDHDLMVPCKQWFRRGGETKEVVDVGMRLLEQGMEELLHSNHVVVMIGLRPTESRHPDAAADEDALIFTITEKMIELTRSHCSSNTLLVRLCTHLSHADLPESLQTQIEEANFLYLEPLTESQIDECICHHFEIPLDDYRDIIPSELAPYCYNLVGGNAMYLGEVLEKLEEGGFIHVISGESQKALTIDDEFAGVDANAFNGTAMMAHARCRLSRLTALEAHVLGMASLFESTFTAQDLASASFSRWRARGDDNERPMLNAVRVLRALTLLADEHFLKRPEGRGEGEDGERQPEVFLFEDAFLRMVVKAGVSYADRLTVKRQVLANRILTRDLPARMEEARKKRAAPHIPWYYQVEQHDAKAK